MATDKERLDWLEEQANGIGLVNDDGSNWAVTSTGMQPVPMTDGPWTFSTTYLVEASECRPTVREAIDAAMEEAKRYEDEAKESP